MTTTTELTPLLKRLKLGAVLNTLPERVALARREQLDFSSLSASPTILPRRAARAFLSSQSMHASPFTLPPTYLSYPQAAAHSSKSLLSTSASARINLTIPSARRLYVSFTAPRSRM